MSAGARDRAIVGVEEELDLLVAQALDVEGVARDEMPEPLDRLGRADQAAGAAAHRLLAVSCSRTAWLPQTGQSVGKLVGLRRRGRFSETTSTICGMTSPARWMTTVSPMRMSRPSRIGWPLLPMP